MGATQVVFMCYKDVIKTVDPLILQTIRDGKEYYKYYKDYVDLDRLKGLSLEELLLAINGYPEKNILKYLSKKEFDYELTYSDLYLSIPNLIKESPFLVMGEAIPHMLKQSIIKKIYIYSDEFEYSISEDIRNLIGSENRGKVTYLTGEFTDVVKSIGENITLYVLNDVLLIDKLIECNKIRNSTVLVNSCGYNYTPSLVNIGGELKEEPMLKLEDLEDKELNYNFKTMVFSPFNTSETKKGV